MTDRKLVIAALATTIAIASVSAVGVVLVYQQNVQLQQKLRSEAHERADANAVYELAWRQLLGVQFLLMDLKGDVERVCKQHDPDEVEILLRALKVAAFHTQNCDFAELATRQQAVDGSTP
jgi:hypothetical protein